MPFVIGVILPALLWILGKCNIVQSKTVYALAST